MLACISYFIFLYLTGDLDLEGDLLLRCRGGERRGGVRERDLIGWK